MNPRPWFSEAIQRLDPYLRLKWDGGRDCWWLIRVRDGRERWLFPIPSNRQDQAMLDSIKKGDSWNEAAFAQETEAFRLRHLAPIKDRDRAILDQQHDEIGIAGRAEKPHSNMGTPGRQSNALRERVRKLEAEAAEREFYGG